MSDTGWMVVAFAAVAAGLGGYLLSIGLRQRGLKRRLERTSGRGRAPDR